MVVITTHVKVKIYGNKWKEHLIYPWNEEMHPDRSDI